MDTVRQDVRHALRGLRQSPAFTLAVVLTLGLGIGGNATVFTALRAAFLVDPPYPHPDRLMALDLVVTDAKGAIDRVSWSFPKFQTLRASVTSFDAVAVRGGVTVALAGGEQPVRVYGEAVTAEYFAMFGAAPLLGRLTTRAEDAEAADPRSVVLGHDLWRQQFGADPSTVGREIRINGVGFEVVGIMRPDFRGVSGRVELWLPVRALPAVGLRGVRQQSAWHRFQAFGLRRADLTADQAAAEVGVVGAAVAAAHPPRQDDGSRWSAAAVSLSEARTNAEGRTLLAVLGGTVMLVLLLVCVNVANLLLARSASRERELAIRTALGAGRWRLVRQLTTEALILAGAGGALGLVLSFWGTSVLRGVLPPMTGPNGVLFLSPAQVWVDFTTLAYTAALALATGLAMSILPAWRSSNADGSRALRESTVASGGLGSLRRPTVRGALVVAQVALAAVLLAGAGLMVQTLTRLSRVDPGFQPDGLLTFAYALPTSDPRSADAAFHARIVERLQAVPGVEQAALSSCAALSGCYDINSVERLDRQPPFAAGQEPSVRVHIVSDAYFRTLGIPVIEGRTFTPAD